MATKKTSKKNVVKNKNRYTAVAKGKKMPKATAVASPKVVEAVDKEVKVYGLCTKTYTIGDFKVVVKKDKTLKVPKKVLPLLEGLKVVKRL